MSTCEIQSIASQQKLDYYRPLYNFTNFPMPTERGLERISEWIDEVGKAIENAKDRAGLESLLTNDTLKELLANLPNPDRFIKQKERDTVTHGIRWNGSPKKFGIDCKITRSTNERPYHNLQISFAGSRPDSVQPFSIYTNMGTTPARLEVERYFSQLHIIHPKDEGVLISAQYSGPNVFLTRPKVTLLNNTDDPHDETNSILEIPEDNLVGSINAASDLVKPIYASGLRRLVMGKYPHSASIDTIHFSSFGRILDDVRSPRITPHPIDLLGELSLENVKKAVRESLEKYLK